MDYTELDDDSLRVSLKLADAMLKRLGRSHRLYLTWVEIGDRLEQEYDRRVKRVA